MAWVYHFSLLYAKLARKNTLNPCVNLAQASRLGSVLQKKIDIAVLDPSVLDLNTNLRLLKGCGLWDVDDARVGVFFDVE